MYIIILKVSNRTHRTTTFFLIFAKVTVALRFPLHLITNPKLTWDDRAICKHSDMDTDYYLEEGFLAVQAKLSEALIRAKNESAILPEVMVNPYPDPKHLEGTFMDNRLSLTGVLLLPFTISAAYLAQVSLLNPNTCIW